mgnify:CR=1 FL=1
MTGAGWCTKASLRCELRDLRRIVAAEEGGGENRLRPTGGGVWGGFLGLLPLSQVEETVVGN